LLLIPIADKGIKDVDCLSGGLILLRVKSRTKGKSFCVVPVGFWQKIYKSQNRGGEKWITN
jgi:hypothetical protein